MALNPSGGAFPPPPQQPPSSGGAGFISGGGGGNQPQSPTQTGAAFSVSSFSAFHLLRNYNYLLSPTNSAPALPAADLIKPNSDFRPTGFDRHNFHAQQFLTHNLLNYHMHLADTAPPDSHKLAHLTTNPSLFAAGLKRQRGEKKPIPEEQKDEKYFERRRRNNQAAKKSRDARKIREDQIALRATILEHENAILKAQVLTLREEATSLRQLLMQKKSIGS